MSLDRRTFLGVGAAAGAAGLVAPSAAFAQDGSRRAATRTDERVVLAGDGLALDPQQQSTLLARLVEEQGAVADNYILGGAVEELEAAFARVLGKEAAVLMPTGTLANHLAVRALANGPGRAILQADSHLYQDCGDCVQTLSNITVMPVAPGRATFTADDVQQVIDQTRSGRVQARISVMSIESPVRRRVGETFDPAELVKVVALARKEGIALHLDGARLFLEAAYAGKDVADYTKAFDTVYVSLYKYFNAPFGAVLAGPRTLLENMFHVRRMFGGSLYQAWPAAAVALHYLDGFSDRYRKAIALSEAWIQELQRHDAFAVTRVTRGTNLFRLRVTGAGAPGRATALQQRLGLQRILLPNPSADGTFTIGVNETWLRTSASELASAFVASAG